MNALHVSLLVLAAMLALVYLTVLARTWCWKRDDTGKLIPTLKGFALPVGSIRGLIALLVVGGFMIFIFFGRKALEAGDAVGSQDDLYVTVFTAFATLTGAVIGFYFGGRGSQSPPEREEEPEPEPAPDPEPEPEPETED